jgi:hypothetical protein
LYQLFRFRNTKDYPGAFALGESVRWDHRFSKAIVPVNESIRFPFRSGAGTLSDQYSSVPFAHDTLQIGAWTLLEGKVFGRSLQIWVVGGWSKDYLYEYSDACVPTDTGCYDVPSAEALGRQSAARTIERLSFEVDAYYFPVPELGLVLGYTNDNTLFAPDGIRRSPFYSPASTFFARFILSIDGIYEAARGTRRADGFYLPG